MAEDTTPDGKRLAIARRQADREGLLRELRRAQDVPPDWDDHEEPSVRVEGEPAAVAELLERVRRGPVTRIRESLAPKSRRGKVVLGGVSIGALVSAAVALVEILRQAGVFER